MNSADQFSFHTDDAIKILNALIKLGKGKGPRKQGDENYLWELVA